MKIKIWITLSLLILGLVIGCTNIQEPSKELVKYVCQDGSTVNNPEKCKSDEKSLVEVSDQPQAEVSGKISSGTLDATPVQTSPEFTILQHNSKAIKKYGTDYFSILGEVKNEDDVSHNYVKVVATLYNEQNKIIGTESSFIQLIEDLKPNQVSPFEITFAKADYPDFNNYKLQVT